MGTQKITFIIETLTRMQKQNQYIKKIKSTPYLEKIDFSHGRKS
jgi:hypothetical protein